MLYALLQLFLAVVLFSTTALAAPEVVYKVERYEHPAGGSMTLISTQNIEANGAGMIDIDHSKSFEGLRSVDKLRYIVRPYSLTPNAPYVRSVLRNGSVEATGVQNACSSILVATESTGGEPPLPCDQFPPFEFDGTSSAFVKAWGAVTRTISFGRELRTSGATSNSSTFFAEWPGVPYYAVGNPIISWVKDQGFGTGGSPPPPPSSTSRSAIAGITYAVLIGPVPKRELTPGGCNGASQQVQCGEDPISGAICLDSGNAIISCKDPVPTRGYPLKNNIHVNSQAVNFTRPMANASFTYDIHVREETVYDINGVPSQRRMLVDGDGARYDYGEWFGAIVPEPGAYAIFTQNGNGTYTVSEAGPPESIKEAGNFTYNFDSSGRLLTITDPSGNQQSLVYDGSQQLIRVDDVSSGKKIEFTWASGAISTVTENGGGAVTALTYTGGRLTNLAVSNASSGTAYTAAFGYSSGRLSSFTRDGDPNTTVNFTYYEAPARQPSTTVPLASAGYASGRKANIMWDVSAFGSVGPFVVTKSKKQGTVWYGFNGPVKGDLVSIGLTPLTGAGGSSVLNLGYDANRNLTSFVNDTESMTLTYSPKGKVTSITDASGNYTNFTYSGSNLTGISDNLGTVSTIGYTNPSLPNSPTTVTDALGNIWTYGYNSFGQVTSLTPPSGGPVGATTYTYDETSSSSSYGLLKEIEDGQGDLTTFDSYSLL
jgi:YD repeat-containing protein